MKDLRVTIRLLPDKHEVYEEFKDNVIHKYHSDICYVMTSLMEAFNQATNKLPNTEDPVVMKFIKQNVQINVGCNFNYNVKKARRIQTRTDLTVGKNIAWPNFIEEYPNMTKRNQQFWLNELRNHNIIPPNPNNPPKTPSCDKSHTMLHAFQRFVSFVRGRF